MQPIFFVTGPPAVGKTTIGKALLKRFSLGYLVQVDDVREAVASGFASNNPWTAETTHQFFLAEQSACDLALRYNDANFAVVIDHCAGPPNLDNLIEERLLGRQVYKIALVANLETNLYRNQTRKTKSFDCRFLDKTIERLNPLYMSEPIHEMGWIVFDNSEDDIDGAVDRIMKLTVNASH
jgi:adenylate kinase family enzyme